ncbi:hypothetical protein DFJ73DRAFT_857163 [Zopfochytrium polystomum]|nr:hypothetical protein DFJ73DRAFT_857163 [Zopfochytrium polystomum]
MLMIMVTHIPVTDPRCDQPFQELVIFLASAIWLAGKGLLSNPFQPNQKFPVLVGSREEFSSLVAAVSNFYFDDSPENILQTIDACELHFAENHSHLADLSARCLLHLCGTSQYLRLRAYCLFLSAREELPSQLRIGAWRVAPDILMSFEEDLWHWFLTHASLSGQDDQDLLEIASLQLGWIACSITKSRSSGTVCSLCDLAEEEPPARASSVEAIAVWNRFQFLLSNQLDESIRLNFLSSLVRLALHSPFQSIDSKSSEIFLLALAQLVSSHPRIRLAIGSILPFFLRRPSVPSFKALEVNTTIVFREIRKSLQRKEIAVSDTLLITTGMLGIDADENLFLHVLFILLTLLKEDDFHLRTLVHRQFHVIAGGSPTQVLDFLLPYFDELSQFLASDPRYLEVIRELAAICGVTLKEFLDKLNPLLIPKMLSIGGEAKLKAIEDVAGVVDEDVKVLCINELPVVLSSELMAEVASGTVDSILSYLGAPSAIDAVIRSWAFPIILNLVLKLGEPSKRVKANEALKVVASKCEPDGNGMALQKCISTFYLAILSHMNGIILDSKGVRKHSDRVKCLKSFGQVMKLMSSKDLSSAIPQTLAILQTAMEFSGLRDAALDSWHSFLDTVQGGSLAPIVNQILAALLKSFPLCTPEQTRQMAQLCGFLLFEKASLRDALPLDLPSFPDCPEFADLRSVVAPLLQRQNVIDRLKALTKAISHESTAVVEQSLIQFEKLVLQHQLSTSRYLLDDTSTDFVNDVLESLLRAFRRFNGVNSQIQTLCCRCIGLIGAVDPARIRFSVKLEVDTNLDQFGDKDSARRFSCKLIEKYLVPSLLSTGNSKRLGPLSFAIQEILHFVGFTAEIGDESETYFAMREGRKEDHGRKSQGTAELVKLRNWWMEFPESVRNTIKPLLKSKYFMEKSIAASVEYPIFVKSYGYKEWILSWVKDLAEKCHGSFAKPLFAKCMIVVDTGDTNLACFLLPYLVLNVLMNGNASHSSQIQCELTAVLGDLASTQNVTDLEKDHLGAQTVFTLLDHLTMWARQRRVEASRRTIAKAKRVGKFISAEDPDEELDVSRENVESLLKGVPHALMAKASYRCKAFARALLHCELSIRHERGTDSKAELQDSYSFLQKIYSNLGEPDGMEGIMSLFSDPSLEQQILDHEAAGRWSAAHSCYELALQFAPDQLELHKGLLTCLKNLGLFETMLTHAKGAATKEKDEWQQHLEPFATEAAWRLGHWDLFAQVPKGATGVFEADVGFLLHHLKQGSASVFYQHSSFLYDQIIGQLAAESMDSYSRCYNSVVKLHILSELQSTAQLQTLDDAAHAELLQVLDCRLKLTLPTLKTRDLILSARRALLDSRSERAPRANAEVGKLWLQSSKLMRRAGYHQSAYGAILQAAKVTAPGAIIEKAKWLLDTKQPHRAITELKNFTESTSNVSNEEIRNKASLLLAQTMEETGVGTANVIISILHAVIQSQPDIEKGYFLLGNFHNKLLDNARNNSNNQKLMVQPNTYNLTNEVCKNYAKSLVYGTKHMSQTLPKLLTLWLDLGALTSGSSKQATPEEKAVIVFSAIDKLVSRLADKVPPSLFLMVLPQLISRICHGNPRVYRNLEMILVKLTMAYPQQTLWHLVSVSRSRYRDRASKCSAIFSKVKSDPGARNTPSHGQIESLIQEALKLTDELLAVCNYPIQSKVTTMSVSRDFRGLSGLGSLKMVVPTQKTMTAILPAAKTSSLVNRHPFPANPATIAGFQDEVEIMNSLQKPRKLVVIGSDGRDYIFLLKPKDDLRKDARLMEFNGLINKLLKQDPESRKRNLYIRTYAVVPLNEECGIIEWVENTSCFRHIVVKAYRTKGIHYTHQNVKAWFDQRGTRSIPEVFVTDILPRFPPIFFEWFLDTFPEPTKWFASRRAYSSTLAVMSMVGFVVGLGDRHGENILFDELTGDCVHVDFNCLFEKGLSFDTPEVVPFRLTHNLVDACGLSGVEGVFRRACEVSLSVLRNNRESLGAVLETFIYDPLCEWSRRSSDPSNVKRGETENAEALKHLQAINAKLQGKVKDGLPLSVQGQVDELIAEATDSKKLGVMYIGWTAYY